MTIVVTGHLWQTVFGPTCLGRSGPWPFASMGFMIVAGTTSAPVQSVTGVASAFATDAVASVFGLP